MTAQGRYAAPDSSFGRSAGNAAARGGALIAVAVVIGFLLLWQGGVGGSGDEVTAATTTEDDSSSNDDTGDAADEDTTDAEGSDAGTTDAEGSDAGTDGAEGADAGTDDGTVEDTTDTVPVPVTRPPGDVKVAVANGVGEAGLAGAREAELAAVGYVTAAVNAAAPTAPSQVYYVEGYGDDALAVAETLGGDAAVLRPAPTDTSALVDSGSIDTVAGFHVFVILGSDRVLG